VGMNTLRRHIVPRPPDKAEAMAPLQRARHMQLRKWARKWPNFDGNPRRSGICGAQDPHA